VSTALAFWNHTESVSFLAGIFFVAGLYVAVQEALEATVTADMVMKDSLTLAYGAMGTVNGVAKFVSSAAVGVLWTMVSPTFSFGIAAIVMFAGAIVLQTVRDRDHSAT
jgi:hypothetical protein